MGKKGIRSKSLKFLKKSAASFFAPPLVLLFLGVLGTACERWTFQLPFDGFPRATPKGSPTPLGPYPGSPPSDLGPRPSPSPSPSPVPSISPQPASPPSPSPSSTPSAIPSSKPSSTPSPSSSSTPSNLFSTAGFCANNNVTVKTPAYQPAVTPLDSMGKIMAGYFETWFERAVHPGEHAQTELANIAPYFNLVNVSFMRPDATYVRGSLNLATTGVGYASGGRVLKDAIALLKSKGTRVLISVGGATYENWDALNVQAIKDFVDDFNLDGVDIDFEGHSVCTWAQGGQTCSSDANYERAIEKLRAALPRPKILATAAWSIGAYGQGPFVCDTPMATRTGMLINPLLKDGDLLDLILVMSYDAGPYQMGNPKDSDKLAPQIPYYPLRAIQAYRQIFRGHIAAGIEVPQESWGGNQVTLPQVNQMGSFVMNNGFAGLMLWALHGSGNAPGSLTPQQISTEMCNSLNRGNCTAPILGR